METSLRFDGQSKNLEIFAKENFVSEGNIILSFHGTINTQSGAARGKVALRKKFFPEFLTNLDAGAKLDSDTKEVTYYATAKKTLDISDNGLLSLDLKGGYFWSQKQTKGKPKARVELCQKIFNFTEDQDLKLKLGYDVLEKSAYCQLRENNWTLNTDLKGNWSAVYDL